MVRPAREAAAARQAHDDRYGDAEPVMELAGDVNDLVEGAGDEIRKLHLADRSHSDDRGPDGPANDRFLADRRVDHPVGAELRQESVGDLERTAVDADVLAEQDDALILTHRNTQGVGYRFEIAQLRHQRKPLHGASPSPIGIASPSQNTPVVAVAGSGSGIASASVVA